MKRWLCLVLALLMMSAAVSALAEAPFMPGAEAPQGLTGDGERFYFVSEGTVYACAPDGAPAPFVTGFPYDASRAWDSGEYVNKMFVDGGRLYGFNSATGDLYAYALEEGEAKELAHIQIDLTPVTVGDGESAYTAINDLVAAYGKIWCYHENWQADRACWVSFDLADGSAQIYETQNLSLLTPYRDGTFLAFCYDENNAYDPESGAFAPAPLGVFDPAADTFTELRKYPLAYNDVQKMTYDPASDTLYICTGNRIYRMAAMQEPELCAYSPFSYLAYDSGFPVAGGMAGIAGETGFVTRSLDPAKLPTEQLTIAGSMNTAAHMQAVAMMGDVPVLESENMPSGDDLLQALLTGEADADIYCLNTAWYDLPGLLQKGYFAPLTGSAAVSDFMATLWPFFQDAGTEGGVVYGVPATFSSYLPGEGSRDVFFATGLEKPKSLTDVIDLFQSWGADGLYETYPDYLPMEWMGGNYRETLITRALELWGHYLTAQNRAWTLDDPMLRQVLEQIDALDTGDWEPDTDDADAWEAAEAFFERTALITPDMGFESPQGIASYGLMPLSLTDETAPYVHMDVYVLLINARSAHKDAALRYIENYIAALSDTDRAAMVQNWNEPVPDPASPGRIADQQAEVERLEKALETAAEIDRPELESDLENAKDYLRRLQDNPYLVSPEDLDTWKNLMTYAFAERPSMFYTRLDPNRTLGALRDQYADRLISLDQFLAEGQRIVDMILKESQ